MKKRLPVSWAEEKCTNVIALVVKSNEGRFQCPISEHATTHISLGYIGLVYGKGHHSFYPKKVRGGCWNIPFIRLWVSIEHTTAPKYKCQATVSEASCTFARRTAHNLQEDPKRNKKENLDFNSDGGRKGATKYSSYCLYRGLYITCMYAHVSTLSLMNTYSSMRGMYILYIIHDGVHHV